MPFDEEQKKQVEEISKKVFKKLGQESFVKRKITDTPTDAFSLVNRRFVKILWWCAYC